MGLEEHGRFWWHHDPVPDGNYAPETSVTGTLKIDDNDRTTLDLHGALLNTKQTTDAISSNNQIPETAVIQGRLNGSGRRVLLTRLTRSSMKFGSYGIFEGYRAEFCLIGDAAMPASMEEPAISTLEVELDGYEEWLRLGSIDYSRTDDGFSAKYIKDVDLTYALDDGTLGVKYELYAPQGTQQLQKMEARQVVSLVYGASCSLTIKKTIERYQLIQDLLILLTNSNHALGLPVLSLEGIEGSYTLHFQRNKGDERGPSLFDAWMDFPELKPRFGQIFLAWKQKREVFGPAFYLYLGTRRGLPQYIENRFLNLIVGIEAFHREKFPENIASEKLVRKIARILGNIQLAKDQTWLSSKLANAAEPSLEERLYGLFSTLPFGFDEKVLRTFARDCAKLRNDVSHFGGWRKHGDYNDFMNEAHSRSEVISCLYQTLILREIGLNDDVLARWLRNSHKSYPVRMHMERFGLWKSASATEAPQNTKSQQPN